MTTPQTIALSVLVFIAGVFVMAQLYGYKVGTRENPDYIMVALSFFVPLIVAICVGVLL